MASVSAKNVSRCTGCMTCELICSFVHEGECKPALSKVRVYREPFTGETKIEVGDDCDLCGGETECIRWCPAGVFKLEKEGSR